MRGWLKTKIVSADNPILGDMHLTAGDSTTVEGDVATEQEIRSRLLLFRGSYFLDLREGVPWYQEILRKGYAPARVRELLRQTIATHPAVIDVPSVVLSVDRATRAASVTFEARTIEGVTIRSEDFGPVTVGGTVEP